MLNCNIVYSINVHEKPDFLLYQLKNIEEHTNSPYYIILNCNEFMYKNLSKNNSIRNNNKIIINQEYFNKVRGTGLLFKGIYVNLLFAINNINFNYFFVLSSRNLFNNKVNKKILDTHYKSAKDIVSENKETSRYDNLTNWHWPQFKTLKVSKYLKEKQSYFYGSAHEGLCINYKTCIDLNNFFINHTDFLNELFNCKYCVEEFIIQTLAVYTNNSFMDMGCGVSEQICKNKFVFKTQRVLKDRIETFLVNKHGIENDKMVKCIVLVFVFIILFIILKYTKRLNHIDLFNTKLN